MKSILLQMWTQIHDGVREIIIFFVAVNNSILIFISVYGVIFLPLLTVTCMHESLLSQSQLFSVKKVE